MKILFWNVHRNKNINRYIASIVEDNEIDILVMAEYNADENELYALFRENQQNLIKCFTSGCDRINVWSNYVNIKSGSQGDYHSIQILLDKYVLCCVHLISDVHGDRSEERLEDIHSIMYDIQKTEEDINSQRTIIIGDFNEMPYGKGCLNANGLHGLPELKITDEPTRSVDKKNYRKFYNPMWSLMGDFSYPAGTYYLNQSKLHSPMWYMHDQVIISQEVLPVFIKEKLKIITTCSYADLKNKNQHPNKKISDHFPIICEIRD
ncbi:endonuclease/exonuclease/phosphatase family protein [bacterium D16-54]|nr:endonuclease/exonuclease/phosphatase family protein [bacterium D16-54]RKJ09444.1 endonuclease/exonuclease/phosphatase family protein [bacterium D16-56]